MLAEEIIIKPILTEKSVALAEREANEIVYTFKVNKKATKVDIKNAVQNIFGVKVVRVATTNVKGTTRTRNGKSYKTAGWKKAMVTVASEIANLTYTAKGGKEVKASKKFNTEIKEFGL